MRAYEVFQQQRPEVVTLDNGDKETRANLVYIRRIDASSGAEAIEIAKTLPIFRIATGLAKFPIVGHLFP